MGPEDQGDEVEEFVLDSQMIWGTRIDPESIKVYLNEYQTMTFTNEAARSLLKALIGALEEK